VKIQPYLFFEGRCEEAIEFYRRALGAQVEAIMRYRDHPDPQPGMFPPNSENKVMHAAFRIGETTVLASDGHCSGKPNYGGFSLTLYAADEVEAKNLFNALCDGGEVRMPLAKTFFSPAFGMAADRFGVPWMVIVMS
jgi:PhnB protein